MNVIDSLNVEGDFVEVTKMSEEELGSVEEIRADACQVVVVEESYRFQCCVKNTNIHLYSADMDIKTKK